MLARVVEAAEGRIVAVIGGDDAIIARAQCGFDRAKPRIEGLKAGSVAGHVSAMAKFGVEIDQIDDNEPAVGGRRQRLEQEVDIAVVALALAFRSGVAVGENVADLADRDDRALGARSPLKQIAVRRGNREILAIGGADEVPGASPMKGRAMTRPMLSGSQRRRAILQSS